MEIASIFDTFFAKVDLALAASILAAEVPSVNVASSIPLYLHLTTGDEVLKCINNLRDSAAGQDGIKAGLLKAIGPGSGL